MNLRQKVKKAKRDLKLASKKYDGSTMWDIYQKFQIESDLNEIIDYKRKPNRTIFQWNKDYREDLGKLTYASFRVSHQELCKIKSSNGRPLTKTQLLEFMNKCREKLYHHGLKIQQEDKNDKIYVDYILYLSDCKTKQKRLYVKDLYRQYYGDDKIYAYNNKKENV